MGSFLCSVCDLRHKAGRLSVLCWLLCAQVWAVPVFSVRSLIKEYVMRKQQKDHRNNPGRVRHAHITFQRAYCEACGSRLREAHMVERYGGLCVFCWEVSQEGDVLEVVGARS